MLENRESRGDRRVNIAGNTLAKEKIFIPVTERIVKSSAKPSNLNWKNLRLKKGKWKSVFPSLKAKIA